MLTIEPATEAPGANAALLSWATRPRARASASLRGRLIEAWSCFPDRESDLPKLRLLFSIALGVILLFVTVCLFNADWYEPVPLAPLPLRLLAIALTLAGIAAMPLVSTRHWRWWAMGFCLTLVISFFMSAVALRDEE